IVLLAHFEVFLDRQIHIPTRGTTQVIVARLRIAIPEQIRKHSFRRSYCSCGKSVYVVLQETSATGRNYTTIGKRDRSLSVIPMLQCLGYFQRFSRHAIRQIVERIAGAISAWIVATIRQRLHESALRQEISCQAPSAEQRVEEATLSVEPLS